MDRKMTKLFRIAQRERKSTPISTHNTLLCEIRLLKKKRRIELVSFMYSGLHRYDIEHRIYISTIVNNQLRTKNILFGNCLFLKYLCDISKLGKFLVNIDHQVKVYNTYIYILQRYVFFSSFIISSIWSFASMNMLYSLLHTVIWIEAISVIILLTVRLSCAKKRNTDSISTIPKRIPGKPIEE